MTIVINYRIEDKTDRDAIETQTFLYEEEAQVKAKAQFERIVRKFLIDKTKDISGEIVIIKEEECNKKLVEILKEQGDLITYHKESYFRYVNSDKTYRFELDYLMVHPIGMDYKEDKYNDTQVICSYEAIKEYLKYYQDKVIITTQNNVQRKIKYVDYHVTHQVENSFHYIKDSLVYIYEQYDASGKYLGEYYVPIDENTMTLYDYRRFISSIDEDEIDNIMYGN